MKKLLVILAVLLSLSLAFVACNKDEPDDESNYETTNTPTEVSSDTTSEDTSNDTTSEDTSNDTTTEEATTVAVTEESSTEDAGVNKEELIEFISKVDEAMSTIDCFERIESTSTYTDGQSMGSEKTVTRYDGYYAHIADYIDDELVSYTYLVDNVLLYNDGSFYEDVVVILSDDEYNYFLNEMVFEASEDEGGYTAILESFKSISLSANANGGYDLYLSEPTDEFITLILGDVSGMSIEISGINYLFKFNSDYTAHAISVEIAMSMMGMEITTATTEEYIYDEFYLDADVPLNFDGHTVVEFEDIFGYLDVSYGKDLGLDVESDNFVLDYKNQERLIRQLDYLDFFIDQYIGKNFTIYGTVYSEDEVCMVEVCGIYYDIIFDGVTPIANETLACLTGTFAVEMVTFEGVEYPVVYFNVTSAAAIAEDDIPEGGYLPWTAYVTAKSLNVRSSADFSSGANNKVGVLNQNTEVKVVGFIPDRYCMIEYHWETADGQSGEYAFVSLAYLSKLPAYYITLDENYKPVNAPV